MQNDFVCQGRAVSAGDLGWLRRILATYPDWSRKRLARALCQRWRWHTAQGRLKDFAARSLLLKLQARGLLQLPPLREQYRTRRWEPALPANSPGVAAAAIDQALAQLQPLRWMVAGAGSVAEARLHEHLQRYHYLGLRVVGENLKYLVQTQDGRDVACLLFGAAAWQNTPRDQFLGWSAAQRTNWQALGQTRGRGRQGPDPRVRSTSIKAIFVYPLHRHFRQRLPTASRSAPSAYA